MRRRPWPNADALVPSDLPVACHPSRRCSCVQLRRNLTAMASPSEAVDWDLAVATGVRTAGVGPVVSPTRAAEEVAALRAAAQSVRGPVAGITQLPEGSGAPAVVVDRAEWIRANVDSMRELLSQVRPGGGPAVVRGVTTRFAGLQLGVAFGWIAGRVLGQYEGLPVPGRQPRLLLVAPNVMAAAQAMDVDPSAFRTWVCVHEETHRQQFTSVPWMPEHFGELINAIVQDLDVGPRELASRISDAVNPVGERPKGIAMLHSREMRAQAEGLLGLMSLLEGHADWVMDQSGEIVAQADDLRQAFEGRRRSGSVLDALLRRILGLEAKLAQYRDGAAFVRAVVGEVGLDGFNAVWAEPANLPTLGEIHQPRLWLDRVVAA